MKAIKIGLRFLDLPIWVLEFPFVYPKLYNSAINGVNALSECDMKDWNEYPYMAADEHLYMMMWPSSNN